jgi:hypothetical protein
MCTSGPVQLLDVGIADGSGQLLLVRPGLMEQSAKIIEVTQQQSVLQLDGDGL